MRRIQSSRRPMATWRCHPTQGHCASPLLVERPVEADQCAHAPAAAAGGEEGHGVFRNVSCVDAQLLGEIDTAYRGEIALFVLDGKYRGRGLGKALYDWAEAYLRAHALMPFYLFTYISCNYRFYERQGLRRRAQHEEVVCVAERKQRMGFFVYEGNDSLCGSAAA